MLYFAPWKIYAVILVCALGIIFSAPNLLTKEQAPTMLFQGIHDTLFPLSQSVLNGQTIQTSPANPPEPRLPTTSSSAPSASNMSSNSTP